MSGLKIFKKIERVRKEAYQLRFTSTLEYVNVSCVGTWRPTSLRVVWYRNHRKVKSIPVIWKASEDRGPNGADGSAKFDPVFSVGLTVTLYKNSSAEGFVEKTYKYHIQDEREDGKKTLATFTLDLADYAREQISEEKLDMTFKPVSKKVQEVLLGLTLTSEFVKMGNEGDCDMQSTYSAMTMDREVEEGEEESHEGERDPAKAVPVHVPSEKMRCGTSKHHPHNALPTGPPTHNYTGASSSSSCPRVSPLTTPSPPSPSPSPLSPTPLSPTSSIITIAGEDRKRSVTAAPLAHSPLTKRAAAKGGLPPQRLPSLSSPPPLLSGTEEAAALSEDSSHVVAKMKNSIQRLEDENKILHASAEVQGWLYKRGVNGPTAHMWRRRYFHFDRSTGNRIYYYKTSCRSRPQGYIDLHLVLRVQEMEASGQDKNDATFHIHCQGRTYQLQATDHETMIRWMKAIQLLVDRVRSTKRMEHSIESSFYVI